MHSASSKEKLEAAAVAAAVLLIAGAPQTALAAIERHEARLAQRPRQAAAQAADADEDSSPVPA